MQDSLEDFIKISRNQRSLSNIPSKQIVLNEKIKQECEARAMQIVHFAIDGKMRSDALFRCLYFITQAHYQDIVEERAISKLCGYPLCSKKIPEMPKKHFHISTATNKVYDITDRKNYCSNLCYQSSVHIKEQIDTTPLWLRKNTTTQQFTLLDNTEKLTPGKLIDQGIIKHRTEKSFTSVASFAQMSLDEAEELELRTQDEEEVKKPITKHYKKHRNSKMKTINEIDEAEENKKDEIMPIDLKTHEETKIDKNEETKPEKLPHTKKIKTKKQRNKIDLSQRILKCFKEWITLDSYVFIKGEEVKSTIEEKLSKHFETMRETDTIKWEQQQAYINICKKLNLKDIADEKFDKEVTGSSLLNRIPDYSQLKEESQQLKLKVKSFYLGEINPKVTANTAKKSENNCDETDATPAILPLADQHSQNALRRKIFLNSLNKPVDLLLKRISYKDSFLVFQDLTNLIKTFELDAENIVFQPQAWCCIAILLLKVLSIKDTALRTSLESPIFEQYVGTLLTIPNADILFNDSLEVFQDLDFYICKVDQK